MLTAALFAVAVTVSASTAARVDVETLKAAAKQAAAEERWCDAHAHFHALHARTGEIKHLYNAAEVARAAHDNVGALAAYREVARRAPADFLEHARVQRAIGELEMALRSGDLGIACASSTPAVVPPVPVVDAPDPPATSATPAPPAPPAPAPPAPPAPAAEPVRAPDAVNESSSGSRALVVAGGVLTGAGVLAGAGFGAWALALESQLRTRAPGVTREQKDAALAAGVPVTLGASAGVIVAGAGAALIVAGLE